MKEELKLWEAEKYDDLVEEGKAIQNRFDKNNGDKGSGNDFVKQFRLQMLNGNVNGALRLLSNSGSTGVLKINDETIQQLHEKHPQGEPLYSEMLLQGPVEKIHPVIFDSFNATLVQKVALRTRGAAGPSNMDASNWQTMLGSRRYGNSSTDLCTAIANMAKVIATENLSGGDVLSALMACRLIPLDKNPGLRPIGVGEVLRRIIGKIVVWVLSPDL